MSASFPWGIDEDAVRWYPDGVLTRVGGSGSQSRYSCLTAPQGLLCTETGSQCGTPLRPLL